MILRGLLILLMSALAGPVFAGIEITLTPGETKGFDICTDTAVPNPFLLRGGTYVGQFYSSPPLVHTLYASFETIPNPRKSGCLLMMTTTYQTNILAGKRGQWALVHFPALGPAVAIVDGLMRVKSK